MFEKKKVSQLVSEFLEKAARRNSKVSENVAKLKSKTESLNKEISEQTSAMIELEIQGDEAGAEKLRKTSRQLRLELAEAEASIDAYANQVGSGTGHSKEIEAIRASAIREIKENQELIQAIRDQEEDLDKEMKAIESKRKELSARIESISRSGPENSLSKILIYIDPRTKSLPSFQHDHFLRLWIHSEDTEHMLTGEPEFRGPISTVSEVIQAKSEPKTRIHTAHLQGSDKRSLFESWKFNHPNVTIVEHGSLDSRLGPLEIQYMLND
ncbi:hypothetical protein PSTEL_13195 [Paenibacillus stellifer]|uniref:Uncharacterized protein n=1 Tax=Paenibacillus stellifer TaxID=169760 RepID=A0A089LQW0_9BACL|nr:hypothetical protein [Paenibacillus stellifer]AIQ63896.1 hypothetical protein PSTEL_13195 [Paenibacillus stellifer]